jgi:DNA-binding transcriptional regulator YiaG
LKPEVSLAGADRPVYFYLKTIAHYLNLSVAYVSQLERSAKQPTGAALTLLNVIKRKGLEAIL